MFRLGLALVLVAACSGEPSHRVVGNSRPTTPGPLFEEVPLEGAAPGLSGLAADDHHHLWAVAERAQLAYQITLGDSGPTVVPFAIRGVPPETDLEAIAWLGGNDFVFGTEGRDVGAAQILFAHREGDALQIDGGNMFSSKDAGVDIGANHGAEGICAAWDDRHAIQIVVAFETAGVVDGRRWAPVLILDREGRIVRRHRLWLTTETGKLSGLDCRLAADGALEVIAIERHFEVTRVLVFALTDAVDVTPRIALDLAPSLHGRLNLEGIAWLDGRVIAVVDNQWKTITGPSELLVFRKGAL